MAITDAWDNPITSTPVAVIGYRGDIDVFPHDLYTYLLTTIREADQNSIGLLYRWLRPMQQLWENQYTNILSLPNLYSPEHCPAEYLEFLGKNYGLTDDISYLWSGLSETDHRKLIRYFVRFLLFRSTFFGMTEFVETMTGLPADIVTYFDFRWILSGDTAPQIESALGREDDGYDIYLLSEQGLPVGMEPDLVEWVTLYGYSRYRIRVNSLVAEVTERPLPTWVLVKYLPSGESVFGWLHQSGSDWQVLLPPAEVFGQLAASPSEDETAFRVSFEPDELVFDVLVSDDGTLDRNMMRGIARLSRPQSERIYLRYYLFIDKFKDIYRWEEVSGTATLGTNEVTLSDGSAESALRINIDGVDEWADYCVTAQFSAGVVEQYVYIRLQRRSAGNYYELRLYPADPPNIPAGTWEFFQVISSTPTSLDSGNLDHFDLDVDYVWRITSFVSARPGGDVQIIRLYQDENLLATIEDDPAPWAGDAKGAVEIAVAATGSITVKKLLVNSVPMESDFVGP
jgi:hypothetical protein